MLPSPALSIRPVVAKPAAAIVSQLAPADDFTYRTEDADA